MIYLERKQSILKQLEIKGVISIKDTAEELKASEITIRRDIEKLEREGLLKRVQGGATSNTFGKHQIHESIESTARQKVMFHAKEKEIVSRYAASLIHDGDCVFIDAGTTTLALAQMLAQMPITLVTNNNLVAQELKKCVADVFIIGGKLSTDFSMNVGAFTLEQLKSFHFDYSFLGCSGINIETGRIFTSELESYTIKNFLIENSNETILLIDDSKLEQTSFVNFANVSRMTKIICNKSPKLDVLALPDNLIVV